MALVSLAFEKSAIFMFIYSLKGRGQLMKLRIVSLELIQAGKSKLLNDRLAIIINKLTMLFNVARVV